MISAGRCVLTDLSTKKQRKKGMGTLSLPRRERTPLSATGAWITVCQRSDNTAPSIPVVQGQTLQSEFFGEHSRSLGEAKGALRKWPSAR